MTDDKLNKKFLELIEEAAGREPTKVEKLGKEIFENTIRRSDERREYLEKILPEVFKEKKIDTR